jgi:putative oxidoreductase
MIGKLVDWLNSNSNKSLLFIRLGIGFMFIFVHGGPKVFGGTAAWIHVGSMIGVLGISFAPAILGLIAGLAELIGGILIAIGLFTRLGAALALSTLLVAIPTMYITTQGLLGAAAAIEDALLMILLIFIGGGKYSLDHWLFGSRTFETHSTFNQIRYRLDR